MKAFKVLNNQDGMMAMMGAMIFTIAITTTLSTFYVYTLNQARYHARIKEAYQLINIMESFAAATRKAYDMGMSAHAGATDCPANAGTFVNAGGGVYYCRPTETCFRREDTNENYCTTIGFTVSSNISQNIRIEKTEEQIASNQFLKSWRKGLNQFYLSPGLKDRVVDTSTTASVIQKPKVMDWLLPSAVANTWGGGEPTPPDYISPIQEPIEQEPIESDDGASGRNPATNVSSYIVCDGPQPVVCGGELPVVQLPSEEGGGRIGIGTVTCSSDSSLLGQLCNNCGNSGQLCGTAGKDGVRVEGEGRTERAPLLPIRQKFSIVR